MEWITYIVSSLFFLLFAILIMFSGPCLIAPLVSDLSSQRAEVLERQKRKAELEQYRKVLKKNAPVVYRAILPD